MPALVLQEEALRVCLVRALSLIIFVGSFATAADFSFSGTFAADDSRQLFSFNLAATSTVTLQTYSYAGGVNQAGMIIPEGGFDPILTLFDSTGLLINENDDGYANVSVDSVTGQHWDSYIHTTLAAGTYTIALTQYDNFPNGSYLSDGFSRMGQLNFTNAFGCLAGAFCDRTGDSRTADWEFDVSGTPSATAIPEPEMPVLVFMSIVFIGAFHRRKPSVKFLRSQK